MHEFGQVQGLHFFIMKFVEGANLRQLENTGRLTPREALQIIPQICDALQYAHDEGVVLRDRVFQRNQMSRFDAPASAPLGRPRATTPAGRMAGLESPRLCIT